MISGIYKITNNINGKSYIGQSIQIEKRWENHKSGHGNSHKSLVHKSIIKYGIDNFTFSILCECPIEKMDFIETYYIRYFDTLAPNGYNLASGGGCNRNVHEDTKNKISNATKKAMDNTEVKNKCSLGGKSNKGKPKSIDSVMKRSKTNTGKKRSEESKQRMREAALRRYSK